MPTVRECPMNAQVSYGSYSRIHGAFVDAIWPLLLADLGQRLVSTLLDVLHRLLGIDLAQ